MKSQAIFRAKPENGENVDDPSESAILLLLQDIEAGQGEFLIIEDLRDPTGRTFIQTAIDGDDEFVVETRSGDADTHVGTLVADLAAAHALLCGWTFDLPGWRDGVTWAQVEL